jgi:predicted transcriptional regulator
VEVRDFCTREVASIAPLASLREAALAMRNRHVGSLVVMEQGIGAARALGILTDRDIVVAVLAVPGARPEGIRVCDVMQTRVASVREQDGVFEVVRAMHHSGVRRLVVRGPDDVVVGMVSAEDVLRVIAGELDRLSRAFSGAAMKEVVERRQIDLA